MSEVLITVIIIAFVAILFLNIYFRVKVFKAYKNLVQNSVQFEGKHMFNAKLLEEEILPKYPEQREEILSMISNMKKSFNLASLLILLIIIAGLILKRTQ